jgi:hypothetical protein
MTDKPGFYDMSADDYHADPAPRPSMSSGLLAGIVSGTLAEAKESHPRLGRQKTEEERKAERSKKYDLGSIAHTLVLGKGREIVVIDAEDWRKKDSQEQRDEAFDAGKQPCLAPVFEKATAMREALMLQLAEIPEERDTFTDVGIAEQAAIWQEQTPLGKLWGRALCDWRHLERPAIRDYKTYAGEKGADPDAFFQGLVRMGKDVQDPWYSRGVAACLSAIVGEPLSWDAIDFKFIVQDPSPPYLVSVVEVADRRWSNERLQWAIDRWAAAAGAGLWRGFVPTTHLVAPPPWAKTQWEQRMLTEWEGEQRMLAEGRAALALKEPASYRVEVEA